MPARNARRPAATSGAELFDPVETDILRRYFGLKPRLDRALLEEEEVEDRDADDAEDVDAIDEPWIRDAVLGVRLEEVEIDADHRDPAIARAVGRLCLHVVGFRASPRRGATPFDTLARAAAERPDGEPPLTAPLLFAVDWAMGSWPESYYAVLVPGFDRTVVVKRSSEECIGGEWLALGWFRRGEDAVASVRRIVSRWWRFEADCTQPRWESFLEAGRISRAQASAWADAVWRDEEEDGEAEDAEEECDEEGAEEPCSRG